MEEQTKLTPRQWALKRFLEENFISGKFWSIEELVEDVKDSEGNPYYSLNTNPYNHDKCIQLSADIKAINWSVTEGYKIIVKDSKGGAKLCETENEFLTWKDREMKPVIRKFQYLNNLHYKAKQDGTCHIINQDNNPVPEPKPVEVFKPKEEEPKKESKPVQMSIWGW